MPYTVWGAFDAFRKNTVDLDPSVTTWARASRDYLYSQLEAIARADPAFPTLTYEFIPYGSFARKTKIRPLDDVDILVILNGRGTVASESPSNPYEHWLKIGDPAAPLARFPDDFDYVSSIKVLNRIRDSLGSVHNYRKAEIKRNMQAVTLNLTTTSWVFDIVPAVPINDAFGGIAYYLIPDGTGDWMRTDPRIDRESVTNTNVKHGGRLLPTMRLLKYWNGRSHKPKLPSYYFETLVLKAFKYAQPITEYPKAVSYFFYAGPGLVNSSCPDPKRLSPPLDLNIDWYMKSRVSGAMAEAAALSTSATVDEIYSRHEQAIYTWGRIFGSEFPGYG